MFTKSVFSGSQLFVALSKMNHWGKKCIAELIKVLSEKEEIVTCGCKGRDKYYMLVHSLYLFRYVDVFCCTQLLLKVELDSVSGIA